MASPGPPGPPSSSGTAHPPPAKTTASTPPAPLPMAAPSIPNLLGRLGNGPPRAGRGGRRGLGRGSGPGGGLHSGHPAQLRGGGMPRRLDHTSIIQSTDTDAAISRMSAVDIGLLEDPFAQYFAGDGGGPVPRRLPIINRGTYTRTQGLDRIIRAFLAETPSADATPPSSPRAQAEAPAEVRQVVSLGAGTDTRSLRFLALRQQDGRAGFQNIVYHEIDFPTVCARKRNIVQSVPAIRSLLTSPITEHTLPGVEEDLARTSPVTAPRSWHAEFGSENHLWAHGLDLCDLAAGGSSGLATLPGLRTDVPTLVVSECCLCYLQPTEAAGVLRWFADRVNAPAASLGVVIYEPIRPFDAFGRTMVANLAGRGIEMPTLVAYPDGAAQEARLQHEAGLRRAKHQTIDQIWRAWVADDEQERVNRLDGLDEVEEWGLLASHYVVVWGSRGVHFDTAWAQLYGQ
ncbi:carboxy methyl transferase for protein phosphatase 2A [Sporothrix curviconia]|uniref:Leucine carboxyl methyltransferase 1 n=1 Tax=Sporothrix curviconia TaxID=1260050 RepID=A0ABP0BQJ6_9PEZI